MVAHKNSGGMTHLRPETDLHNGSYRNEAINQSQQVQSNIWTKFAVVNLCLIWDNFHPSEKVIASIKHFVMKSLIHCQTSTVQALSIGMPMILYPCWYYSYYMLVKGCSKYEYMYAHSLSFRNAEMV